MDASAHSATEGKPCNLCGGDMRVGDMRAGDMRVGDMRAGDMRVGDVRAGDVRAGDVRGAADDGAPACPACASTAQQRAMRRIFQALPHGLLAWRRAALAPGRHGVDQGWFRAGAPASASPDFLVVDLAPHGGDAAAATATINAALATLSARGVAYVSRAAGPGAAAAPELLGSMTALLKAQYLPCSVLAMEGRDPASAARVPAWLLLRDAADGALWQRHLLAWHDAPALAAGRVEDPFAPLRVELAQWQATHTACAFWWRDDDLVQHSDALRRLADISRRRRAPVLMAVIPAQADPALARDTDNAAMATLAFCQHGWAHVNHEAPGQPNSEFGAGRDQAEAEADLARGCARMRELFGARFLPVMVPPWNTLSPALAARLPALGLAGLSQYLFQPRCDGIDGMVRIDTHVDIVDWSAGAGVRDPALLVERLVTLLQLRRSGQLREPVGILSHHRVMAEGSWRFLEQLHAVAAEFSCVHWLHPRVAFQGVAPCAA